MANVYCWSGAAGAATGADWTNAKTTLTAAFVTEVAGDTIFVAHDHAESTASAITLTSSGTVANPSKVICVNRAGSVPPVSADRRATATVTTTAASNITIAGYTHYDGIIFSAATGSGGGNLVLLNSAGQWLRFDNCSLRLAATSGGELFVGGTGTTGGTYVELNNTTVSFGSTTGSGLNIYGVLKWRNTPSALLGAFIPNNLLYSATARGASVELIGVDLSAAGSGKTLVNASVNTQGMSFRFMDCKLNAAVTKSGVPGGHGANEIDFVRSSATGNYAVYRQRISGELLEETTIVRSGGASDGTTPIAWKIVTTANCTFSLPFEAPPIAIWNDTTGSAVTATVECIAAAIMTDAECWLELEYLGDASSPLASFVVDSKADLLATAANQTSSSETWGGSTTKFKLAVSFTAQMKGWVYCRVKVGKASSTTYIDPLITLT